jgi:hypothetical protein
LGFAAVFFLPVAALALVPVFFVAIT